MSSDGIEKECKITLADETLEGFVSFATSYLRGLTFLSTTAIKLKLGGRLQYIVHVSNKYSKFGRFAHTSYYFFFSFVFT